ncbi:MAG: DUF882 domain-containing protein [Xanthobacteraceae bacterium]
MPVRLAHSSRLISGRSRLGGLALATLFILFGCTSLQDAAANGETRTLSFQHTHRDDSITATFKRDGRYDEDGLKKLNYFLRDWRNDEQTKMDPRLFDILWEVSREVGAKEPIHIISSYRSPQTNAMLRRRSHGVAQYSQHMLGNAIDFFIPGVPLEQLRYAGLRLQRGGVGYYPTSGSPFVHVDVGSVRHWPRMTHDQLARVFPDGRTVHLPSNGGPMKGYELARADIERRGNGDDAASVGKKPSLFAALFRGGKSNDEDDEGASVPAKSEKPTPASVMAAAAPAKSADPVPTPRSKPVGSTIQLAAADAQTVSAAKARPESKPEANQAAQASAEPKPQTPADIINSRGFWDDIPRATNQATPAQVAALRARQALAAATDPQPTASVTESFNKAMAYAPAASSPVDRANVVAASAPLPPRPARPARNAGAAATEINTVVAKGPQGGAQGQDSVVATSTRLAAAQGNSIWMRVVMLAPSASNAMSTTVLGDTEMTQMRSHFVKPQAAIAMTFSEDPMMGMTSDRFTGSATAQLPTQSFVMRTAALR